MCYCTSPKVTHMKKTSALIMMLAAAAVLSAHDTLNDDCFQRRGRAIRPWLKICWIAVVLG